MNVSGEPSSVSFGAPVASAVARNAATVPAAMASDVSGFSRAPAVEVTTQPTAIAVLSGDSPASTPPATPITDRAAIETRGRRRVGRETNPLTGGQPGGAA